MYGCMDMSNVSEEDKKIIFASDDFSEDLDNLIERGLSVNIEEIISLKLLTTIHNYVKLGISIDEFLVAANENFISLFGGMYDIKLQRALDDFVCSLLQYACEEDIDFQHVSAVIEKIQDSFMYLSDFYDTEWNDKISNFILTYFPMLEDKYNMISSVKETRILCERIILNAFKRILSSDVARYFIDNFSDTYGDLMFEYSIEYVRPKFAKLFFEQGRTIEGKKFIDSTSETREKSIIKLIEVVFNFHDPHVAHEFFSSSMPDADRSILALMFKGFRNHLSSDVILDKFISDTENAYRGGYS